MPSDRRVPSNCCVSSVPARLWYLAACDQWKCQRFHCNKAQHSITFTITAHLTTYQFIFTILHLCRVVLAMSEMSVRLSVKRVSCDQTKETSAHIFIPRARSSILVFWQEKWLAGTTSCVYCHVKLFLLTSYLSLLLILGSCRCNKFLLCNFLVAGPCSPSGDANDSPSMSAAKWPQNYVSEQFAVNVKYFYWPHNKVKWDICHQKSAHLSQVWCVNIYVYSPRR